MTCINTFCDPVCLCLADLYTKFSFQETRSRSLSLCFSSPSLSFSLFLLSRSLTSGFKKLTFCASASASAAATTNSKATALHSIVIARSNNRDQTWSSFSSTSLAGNRKAGASRRVTKAGKETRLQRSTRGPSSRRSCREGPSADGLFADWGGGGPRAPVEGGIRLTGLLPASLKVSQGNEAECLQVSCRCKLALFPHSSRRKAHMRFCSEVWETYIKVNCDAMVQCGNRLNLLVKNNTLYV